MQRTSDQIILTCEQCGEQLIILGTQSDWRSREAIFLCGSLHQLTLDDYTEEEALITAS